MKVLWKYDWILWQIIKEPNQILQWDDWFLPCSEKGKLYSVESYGYLNMNIIKGYQILRIIKFTDQFMESCEINYLPRGVKGLQWP